MESIIIVVIAALGALGLAFVVSLFGGTLLWLIWPTALDAFPRLVGEGWIEPRLSWWSSVCLVWVFAILIKSTQTNNNK
jgi:hypothetical protein